MKAILSLVGICFIAMGLSGCQALMVADEQRREIYIDPIESPKVVYTEDCLDCDPYYYYRYHHYYPHHHHHHHHHGYYPPHVLPSAPTTPAQPAVGPFIPTVVPAEPTQPADKGIVIGTPITL